MNITDILNTSIGSFTIGALLTAAITLVVCLLVVRAVMKVIARILSRTKLDAKAQALVVRALKAVLYIITAMIVLGDLVDMTSLVALLSVCSLGITLAAEDILGNVAGGLVILSTHPFNVGDYVEADGVAGTVQEISIFHTRLLTPDGLTILVPNRALSSSKITNYTRLGQRRVVVKVTASYDAPTEKVFAACSDAMAGVSKLLSDPAPAVHLSEYGSSSIEYTLFSWCNAADYWDCYFGVTENLRDTFAKHGVEMTYDHLNVHVIEK